MSTGARICCVIRPESRNELEEIRRRRMHNYTKMSRQSMLNLSVLVLLLQLQPWRIQASAQLVPPAGYSLAFTGKTIKGEQKYICKSGNWTKTGSSAHMQAPDGSKLGTYWSAFNNQTRSYTYHWNIINSSGGFGETGQATCGLQASLVQTYHHQVDDFSIPEYLAVVKAHRGSGDGERVAFVAFTSASGGLSDPRKSHCSDDGASTSVPFSGVFKFYNQNQLPPPVPASLRAPKSTSFVENIFVDGNVHYKYVNGEWTYKGVMATIYDVAGGAVLGSYGTVNRDAHGNSISTQTVFKFKNPNGFWLQLQLCAKPVQMSQSGCAWEIYRVSKSGGSYASPFGKFKYVLLTSSLGGLPPQIAAGTNGTTYGSAFTAQCHLFA